MLTSWVKTQQLITLTNWVFLSCHQQMSVFLQKNTHINDMRRKKDKNLIKRNSLNAYAAELIYKGSKSIFLVTINLHFMLIYFEFDVFGSFPWNSLFCSYISTIVEIIFVTYVSICLSTWILCVLACYTYHDIVTSITDILFVVIVCFVYSFVHWCLLLVKHFQWNSFKNINYIHRDFFIALIILVLSVCLALLLNIFVTRISWIKKKLFAYFF